MAFEYTSRLLPHTLCALIILTRIALLRKVQTCNVKEEVEVCKALLLVGRAIPFQECVNLCSRLLEASFCAELFHLAAT